VGSRIETRFGELSTQINDSPPHLVRGSPGGGVRRFRSLFQGRIAVGEETLMELMRPRLRHSVAFRDLTIRHALNSDGSDDEASY
jgi:hypothetical protein